MKTKEMKEPYNKNGVTTHYLNTVKSIKEREREEVRTNQWDD